MMNLPCHNFVTYPFGKTKCFNFSVFCTCAVSPIVKTRNPSRFVITMFDNGGESRP